MLYSADRRHVAKRWHNRTTSNVHFRAFYCTDEVVGGRKTGTGGNCRFAHLLSMITTYLFQLHNIVLWPCGKCWWSRILNYVCSMSQNIRSVKFVVSFNVCGNWKRNPLYESSNKNKCTETSNIFYFIVVWQEIYLVLCLFIPGYFFLNILKFVCSRNGLRYTLFMWAYML